MSDYIFGDQRETFPFGTCFKISILSIEQNNCTCNCLSLLPPPSGNNQSHKMSQERDFNSFQKFIKWLMLEVVGVFGGVPNVVHIFSLGVQELLLVANNLQINKYFIFL